MTDEEIREHLARTTFRCERCKAPARRIGFSRVDRRTVRVRLRCHGQDDLLFMTISMIEDLVPRRVFLDEQPTHTQGT